MTEINNHEVILWYVGNGIDAMMNCLVFHQKKASPFDVCMFSELNMRMRNYCKRTGKVYHEHDLFRKTKHGWVFSGSGWLAHIKANIRTIESISAMRELANAYEVVNRSWAKIRQIERMEGVYYNFDSEERQQMVKDEWVQATMKLEDIRVVTRG